jgi:hypothetical protein
MQGRRQAGSGASARPMFRLAAASIVEVRSHDRRPEGGPDVVLAFIGFVALLIDPVVSH